MTLQFDVNILFFINIHQLVENDLGFFLATVYEGGRQCTFIPTSKANETLGKFFEFIECCGTFSLCFFTELERGNKLAQVLIALLRRAKESYSRWLIRLYLRQPAGWRKSLVKITHDNFGSDMRTN